jgi:hypothetical protein
MQFELERGLSYIFNESVPVKSYEMFNRYLNLGYSGLCFAEDGILSAGKKMSHQVPIIRISSEDRPDGQTIGSKRLMKINATIVEFLRSGNERKILILECMNVLLQSNEFTNLMKFLHQVSEDIAINNAILIMSANLNRLDGKQIGYLDREFRIIGKELLISHLL